MNKKHIIGVSIIYIFLWFILFLTGINPLMIQSEDTVPAMFLPVSLIMGKTLYLDRYYETMVQKYPHPDDKKQLFGKTPFYLKKVNNHYLSAFPIIPGILAVPVYVLPLVFGLPVTWLNLALLSRISAALIVSLSGYFMFKVLIKFLDDKKSLLLTCVYLFGTINFASISQALWQHGPLELFTIVSLYYLLDTKNLKRSLYFAGFFAGLSVITRPTALLPLIILGIYTLKKHGFFNLLRYITPVLIPLAFFFWYNSAFYVDISNQGYASQLFEGWRTPLYKGFLGLWLSPSKGILIYSPVFIFSLVGSYIVLRRGAFMGDLFKCFLVIVLLHTLALGMWKHWYGGWSFGYRMASDIIPYLVLLIVPYLNSTIYAKTKYIFNMFFAVSVAIELAGLAFFDGVWHGVYDRGFKNQSWLWSIKDSELVFYARRVLVKLSILKSPL